MIIKTPKTRREYEVWQACDEVWLELQAEGLQISELTGERIKDKLVSLGYKRGNPSQIYQYRNTWQVSSGIEENPELVHEAKKVLLSEKVRQAIEALFAEIDSEAKNKSNQIELKLTNQIKELTGNYESSKKENELLHKKLDEILQDQKNLQKDNVELKSQLSKEQQNLLLSKEKLTGAEDKCLYLTNELERKNKIHNEYCEKEKKDTQLKIDNLLSAHKQDLSDLKNTLENQRHKYIVEIENLKVTNNKLDKQIEKTTLLEQKANSANDELTKQLRAIKAELDLARQANTDLLQQKYAIEREFAENKGETKGLRESLNEFKNKYQETSKQLFEYKERVGRLEEQNRKHS